MEQRLSRPSCGDRVLTQGLPGDLAPVLRLRWGPCLSPCPLPWATIQSWPLYCKVRLVYLGTWILQDLACSSLAGCKGEGVWEKETACVMAVRKQGGPGRGTPPSGSGPRGPGSYDALWHHTLLLHSQGTESTRNYSAPQPSHLPKAPARRHENLGRPSRLKPPQSFSTRRCLWESSLKPQQVGLPQRLEGNEECWLSPLKGIKFSPLNIIIYKTRGFIFKNRLR